MKAWVALAPLPLACVAGACGARAWFAHAPGGVAVDIAQPLPVVTAWGAYGAGGFAILALTVLASTVVLVLATRVRPRADTRTVVAVAALALIANVAWPVVFSSDAYAYAAYGDLAARGLDPYRLAPADLHDAFLDAARFQWSGPFPVCVYGPAFVAFAGAIVTLAGNVGAALAVLRITACLAFLGSVALLGLALRDESAERRSLALYAFGLNPVALWSVAEGHNDALLVFAAAAAFALARRAPFWGAFGMALGPVLKAPGAALAFLYAVRFAWIERGAVRRIRLGAGAGTLLAALLALPPLLPALTRLGTHGVYAPAVSVQGLIGPAWSAAFALALLTNGARMVARRDARGLAWGGLALVVALPNAYPWYALWLLPIVLAAGPAPASAALWGATIFALVRYLPDATGNITGDAARAASAVVALPFALLLADFRAIALRRKTTPQP